ncbi:MAG: PQQ-binding-like beta-propeller repeat protein [Planctomycetota bacterium]|nr:PQQ-binding-like beta-propeller repeat protein [Planctomycetota bacterium]
MSTIFCTSPAVRSADWPRFRGSDGNAAALEANVPLLWSESEHITWKTPIPGHGASSPVVFAGRIYLTSFSGYGIDPDAPGNREDLQLHVQCYDEATGKLLWDKSLPASVAEQELAKQVANHGFATGTPVVDEAGVYAYFGVSGLVAYDHDGELLWQAKTGDKTAGFGSAASPILYQNLVIINASIEAETVFAFDRNTGEKVWQIKGIDRSWTTPIVAKSADGREELIVSHKMQVRGFEPGTGRELWNCEGIQDYVVPCVVVNEGIAYVLGGRTNQSMAIRLGGNGDVTKSHKIWESKIGANVTSPIYHDGYLYWSSDKGIANCLNASNGESIYKVRMNTKERIYASALLAGGRLYLTTRDNGVFAIALGPKYKELAHNVFANDDSLLNATPAVSGNSLLFRSNRFLYRIE